MRTAAVCLCALAIPAMAAAQPIDSLSASDGLFPSQPAQAVAMAQVQAQGPMLVERVHNGFVFAPDFQIGKVAGRSARFAGAYGGWVFDNRLLIGAAGYGLTNGSRTRGMAYGGALVEWLERRHDWLGFGLRGLVGFGQATLASNVSGLTYPFDADGPYASMGAFAPYDQFGRGYPPVVGPGTGQVVFRRDFFIFEPQVDLSMKLAPRLHLNWGVGYRTIAGAGSFNSQLRGVSGSVGLEFGFGGS